VRRSILETIRGFDEPVRVYGEDYDLCARIYAQGFGIEYVPTARVAHHHRTTFSGLARQAFGFGRAHPYLLRRHARRGLWLELPLRSFACNAFPGPVWIDLRSADKKILLVLALSCVVPAALWLLLPYMAWLIVSCARRARSAGHPVHPTSATALAGLLVLKSAALTAGRWWGSVRYGRLCF
jgi:cellulose synthase/poly-beta-1,6-N-acetylglucosamine synthase-like glycosyltransferase